MKKVAVIMGSDSDMPTVSKAVDTLGGLGIPTEVHIYSAHRTPDEAAKFASDARANGFGAIIAAAGKAAHLAGALAARTTLPVIGLPIGGHMMGGLDALLSMKSTAVKAMIIDTLLAATISQIIMIKSFMLMLSPPIINDG